MRLSNRPAAAQPTSRKRNRDQDQLPAPKRARQAAPSSSPATRRRSPRLQLKESSSPSVAFARNGITVNTEAKSLLPRPAAELVLSMWPPEKPVRLVEKNLWKLERMTAKTKPGVASAAASTPSAPPSVAESQRTISTTSSGFEQQLHADHVLHPVASYPPANLVRRAAQLHADRNSPRQPSKTIISKIHYACSGINE